MLPLIENNFEDFLKKQNLEIDMKNPGKFRNAKYEILFIHDAEYKDRYEELCKKYQRRIERFRREIKKKTCFLRTITDSNELKCISENDVYINEVIKKENKGNEIIFLLAKDFPVPSKMKFPYFVLHNPDCSLSRESMRNWFDYNDEFIEYCITRYRSYSLLKNIMYDRKKEEEYLKITKSRYNLLLKIIEHDFGILSGYQKLIIYGAGNIGKAFYRRIKEKCSVICFVDKNRIGESIDGVPVLWLDEIKDINNSCFIVTATYDYQYICEIIRSYYDDALILSLEELVG